MPEEEVLSTTNSLKRLQSVLKGVFSPKPDRVKDIHSTSAPQIEKSASAADLKTSNDGLTQTSNKAPSKPGILVVKYKHASVQTDTPKPRTSYCATKDMIEADALQIRKMADNAIEKRRESVDREAEFELPKLMGNVSVRRRSTTASNDSITFPKTRDRIIKFDQVAVLLDAAANGDMGELRQLLEGPTPMHVDSCTSEGVTALHVASANLQKFAVNYLISLRAHVNAADNQGNTPLHMAAAKGDLNLVQTLIQAGASVEAMNAEKQTAAQSTPFSDVREYLKVVTQRKMISDQVTAIYDFNRHTVLDGRGDEVSLQRGEQLKVIDREEEDWWLVERRNGERGYVPRLLVQ